MPRSYIVKFEFTSRPETPNSTGPRSNPCAVPVSGQYVIGDGIAGRWCRSRSRGERECTSSRLRITVRTTPNTGSSGANPPGGRRKRRVVTGGVENHSQSSRGRSSAARSQMQAETVEGGSSRRSDQLPSTPCWFRAGVGFRTTSSGSTLIPNTACAAERHTGPNCRKKSSAGNLMLRVSFPTTKPRGEVPVTSCSAAHRADPGDRTA